MQSLSSYQQYFSELEQIISQFVWKYKKTQIAKAILRKKNGTGAINSLTSGSTTKPQSTRQYGLAQRQKYRSMEQNRKPRDKSTHLWAPYLWQRRQKYTMEKDDLFNKWCWKNWSTTCKRMKLEHFLTPYTKINSKWIKDLNYKTPRGEHRQNTLWHKSQQDPLWPTPPKILKVKAKINKWDLIEIKSFCTTKETISKVKDSLQNGRK